MVKSHLLVFGLVLAGSSLFAACSDGISINDGGAGAPAKGGAGGGSNGGAAGDVGDAGSTSPGEGGDAGASDAGPTGLVLPQTVVVPVAAPAKLDHLLVGGTDFKNTEVVSVALADGAVAKGNTYADGDAIAVSSGGVGFVLERTNGTLHIVENGKSTTDIDLNEPGTATAAIDNKAYVPLLGRNAIAIVDLGDSVVSRRIDLSAYAVADDGDKSVDVAAGIYDPTANVAYFLLQRIDRTLIAGAGHVVCSTSPGLLIGIDVATDELVDLNGKAAGKAVELQLANPGSLSINADGTALYILSAGCYEGKKQTLAGVEVVDPSDGSSTVAYAAEGTDYLASLILTKGSEALLQSFDSVGTVHWNTLDIAGGKLVGAELAGVPEKVTYDGKDLVGVAVTDNVGAVVRYAIATGTSTSISKTSWAGDYTTGSSVALVP